MSQRDKIMGDAVAEAALAGRLDTAQLARAVALFEQVKSMQAELDRQTLNLYTTDVPTVSTNITPTDHISGNPKTENPPRDPQMGNRTWDLVQGIIATLGLDFTLHPDLMMIMQESHQIAVSSPRSS